MKVIKIGETNSELFNKEIQNGPAFVKFYMPGCIHCENLKPTWIELENEMKDDSRDLSIIDVHSNAISGINSNISNNVQGFPTIMMIYDNGNSFKMYEGDRSLEDMKKFIDNFLNGNMKGGRHRKLHKYRKSKKYNRKTKSKRNKKKKYTKGKQFRKSKKTTKSNKTRNYKKYKK